MAINIDTSQPLRRPLDLAHLVDEVVKSGSADEASWVECKSDLDLTKHEGRFKVARAVLSFANRMPDTANKTCGGLAYVIVGAEPGNVAGTQEIDAADLESGLRPYLGTDGPVWSPTYVDVNGKKVLVVVIEAPKWGDRMHTLRKQSDLQKEPGQKGTAQKGTVFVRAQSSSRPADDAEIRMLEDRLLRGQQATQLNGLQVGYELSAPNAIPVVDPTSEQIDEWIDQRRTAIENWHAAVIAAFDIPNTLAGAMFAKSLPHIDTTQVEQHLELCRARLFDATRYAFIRNKVALLTMIVTSPGSRILENVEMTLKINTAHSAFEPGDPPSTLKRLPTPPGPPKPPRPTFFEIPSVRPSALSSYRVPSSIFNPGIDIKDNEITVNIGRLRPEKPVHSPQFHVFLHERPTNDKLEIGWTLSSTSTEGQQKGTVSVPVHPVRRVFLPAKDGLPD